MIEEFPHPKNKDESLVFINGYFQNTKNKEEKLKVLEYSELQRVRRVPRLALLRRRPSDGEVFNR